MGTEKERRDTQKAVLYDLRRLLKNSGKDTYSVEELCNLLDTIADAKDQEYIQKPGADLASGLFYSSSGS